MPRRIQSAALAKGLIGLKGVVNATKVVIGQIRGALAGRGTLAGGPLQTHLLSGSSLGSGALVGALANLFSGALLGSGALAGAPQAGAWYEDPAYATLSHVADFNNDRYAMPTESSELIANGNFSNGLTGLTGTGAHSTVVGGELVITGSGGGYPQVSLNVTGVTIGSLYRVTAKLRRGTSPTGPTIVLNSGGTSFSPGLTTSSTTDVVLTGYTTATATSIGLLLYINSGAVTGTVFFDDISMKEVILTPTGRTYGSELIVNGDFATGPTLGSELLDNGDMSTAIAADPATGWAEYKAAAGTAVISGGVATVTADGNPTGIEQNFATTIGQVYEITYTIGVSVLNVAIGSSQGGTQNYASPVAQQGTFTIRITATATTTWIRFWRSTVASPTVDNVSAKLLTQPTGWTLKAPTVGTEVSTISGGTLNLTGDGTNGAYADQSFATTIGQIYEITLTIASSAINFFLGTTQGGSTLANLAPGVGTHTFKFTATGATTWLRLNKTTAALATVDNVSIRNLTALGVYPKREATFAEFFTYTAASDAARTYTENGGTLRPMTYGRTNYVLQSQTFDNATWTKAGSGSGVAAVVTADAGTAPDATFTADRVVLNKGANTAISDYSLIGQVVNVGGVNAIRTFSVYMKTFDGSSKNVVLRDAGGSLALLVCAVTGSWQRFSVTTPTAHGSPEFQIILRGTYGTSDSADLLIWGAQLDHGAEATPYVPTTTAAITGGVNAPRFTWANGKRQLRLENAGANLALRSQDATLWSNVEGTTTVTGDATTAPDGTTTADRINITGTTLTQHGRYHNFTGAAAAFTASCYLKAGTARYVLLEPEATAAHPNSATGATFDLQTGTIVVTAASSTATITSVGNGWYRCTVTRTLTTGSLNAAVYLSDSSTGAPKRYFAPAGTETFFVWGFQVEQSAFATDYIPTTTASVTRAIETARFSPAVEAVLQRAQGTGVVRVQDIKQSVTFQNLLGNGGGAAALLARYSTSANTLYNMVSGVPGAGANTGAPVYGIALGAAIAYDASGRAVAAQGVTNSDATAVAARAEIYIGRPHSSVDTGNTGSIYYDLVGFSPERLPNSNLQALAVAA